MLGRVSLKKTQRRVVAGVGALVIVVGGAGAALAASGVGTPQEESKAVIDAAAQDLGVSAADLTEALETALAARVDAAVAAGRLTEAQGAELKERIAAGDVPLVGLGGGPRGGGPDRGGAAGFGHFGGLEAAADYLGLSEAELRAELDADTSLGEVAEAQGKTVDGLVAAIVAAATVEVNAAATAGRLTDVQRDEILATIEERVTDMVNRAGRRHDHGGAGLAPPADAADA
jgi:hypothetical protein